MCMTICCTVGGWCCNCLCWPAKALGIAQNNQSKLGYVFFHLLMIAITMLIVFCTQEASDGWLSWITGMDCEADDAPAACSGASTFIRLSFALTILHLIMLLVLLPRSQMVA